LRRWSADFQLRAHLLNLRCLSFELRRENFHSLPQFLDFAMLFEVRLLPAPTPTAVLLLPVLLFKSA
jgi:hypothetical protein